jgi:glycerol-3-phosphate dehydrogenase
LKQTKLIVLSLQVAESINDQHENTMYFKGFTIPHNVKASTNIVDVAQHGELLLLVCE